MTVTYDDARYTYDNAFLTYDGVYVVPTLTGSQFAGSGTLTRGWSPCPESSQERSQRAREPSPSPWYGGGC
jgi:hypothetical protein